jgi:hypothetical protein
MIEGATCLLTDVARRAVHRLVGKIEDWVSKGDSL